MTLAEWWEQVFKPIRGRSWSYNTRTGYASAWRCQIEPYLGAVKLADLNKIDIDRLLVRLADAGLKPSNGPSRTGVAARNVGKKPVDNDVLIRLPPARWETPAVSPQGNAQPNHRGSESAVGFAGTPGLFDFQDDGSVRPAAK